MAEEKRVVYSPLEISTLCFCSSAFVVICGALDVALAVHLWRSHTHGTTPVCGDTIQQVSRRLGSRLTSGVLQ